ncbi:MAG TPA: copper chaperone PCu(A)C, partial [Limnochordales bacterium]
MRSRKMMARYGLVAVTVALALVASWMVAASGDAALLEATGVWARPAQVMGGGHAHGDSPSMPAMTSAVYMTLINHGSQPIRVVGARTPVAHAAELHETRIEGMVAKMMPVDAIEVPPGGQVRLQPGGFHIMLVGVNRALQPGDRVPLTLLLDDGSELVVEAVVQ